MEDESKYLKIKDLGKKPSLTTKAAVIAASLGQLVY